MTIEGRAFTDDEYAPGAAEYDRTRRDHSTRSTFQRIWVSATNLNDKDLVAAGPGSGIDRLKRISIEVIIQKGSGRGWIGFQRISEGTQIASGSATAAMFSDAEILRPVPYMANADYAVYAKLYLPAVNLVDDGNLRLRYFSIGGGAVNWVGRYVQERSV